MEDYGALCHPEILAEEKLVEILCSRGIPENEVQGKDKAVLVQLFYRYVVPLPQRVSNMRRANRLRKNLHPIIVSNESKSLEAKNQNRGLKRKQPQPGLEEHVKAGKVLDCVDKTSVDTPTTACAKQINKLTMNCMSKTPVKPVKLSRNFLNKEQQNILNSSPKLNLSNNASKNTKQTIDVKTKTKQESTSSDSLTESEEDKPKTLKKFKRITVTWP